jgi:hypothetical protein
LTHNRSAGSIRRALMWRNATNMVVGARSLLRDRPVKATALPPSVLGCNLHSTSVDIPAPDCKNRTATENGGDARIAATADYACRVSEAYRGKGFNLGNWYPVFKWNADRGYELMVRIRRPGKRVA